MGRGLEEQGLVVLRVLGRRAEQALGFRGVVSRHVGAHGPHRTAVGGPDRGRWAEMREMRGGSGGVAGRGSRGASRQGRGVRSFSTSISAAATSESAVATRIAAFAPASRLPPDVATAIIRATPAAEPM